jgi:hypothetical protein
MSNSDLMPLPRTTQRPAGARPRLAAPLPPFVEKALLFWGFTAAALFWTAV